MGKQKKMSIEATNSLVDSTVRTLQNIRLVMADRNPAEFIVFVGCRNIKRLLRLGGLPKELTIKVTKELEKHQVTIGDKQEYLDKRGH